MIRSDPRSINPFDGEERDLIGAIVADDDVFGPSAPDPGVARENGRHAFGAVKMS